MQTSVILGPSSDQRKVKSSFIALVAAPKHDPSAIYDYAHGSVYLLTRNAKFWSRQAKLTVSGGGGSPFHPFGFAVALSGDIAIVGGFNDFSPAGRAWIFKRSAMLWSEKPDLLPADPSQNSRIGHAVAVSGAIALVGSFLAEGVGSASIFTDPTLLDGIFANGFEP